MFLVIRGFAEASLAVVALAMAILLTGIPIVLIVRGFHGGLWWLVRLGGDVPAAVEALVSVAGVAGGLALSLAAAMLLVRFLRWRGRYGP